MKHEEKLRQVPAHEVCMEQPRHIGFMPSGLSAREVFIMTFQGDKQSPRLPLLSSFSNTYKLNPLFYIHSVFFDVRVGYRHKGVGISRKVIYINQSDKRLNI